jgi:hypothetical protein
VYFLKYARKIEPEKKPFFGLLLGGMLEPRSLAGAVIFREVTLSNLAWDTDYCA